jgi:phenylalanyl-tRNA synthetase beta chain
MALDAAVVAQTLTKLGFEVEGVTAAGGGLDSVVVGELRGVERHPAADKLSVTRVWDGQAEHTVVCGADNLPPLGGKIAFATVGTTLPGGLTLAVRDVRGVTSHGMICSEAELDIGPDGDGILVLDPASLPGMPLPQLVRGVADEIIDVSVNPNRPDALGHVGLARELALALDLELAAPSSERPKAARAEGLVSLDAPESCGRYVGVVLDGVTVRPSPLWLRVRLHRLGLRPRNAPVDVTNLVLMEWGQPLHVFDRDRLAEGRVVIRRARAGESLRTLDGLEHALHEDDLVIADAARPAAIAGVMGGEPSSVTQTTRSIVLEVAWFEPRGVRATSKRHQLHTDSSHRFERQVDHGAGLEAAAWRAAALLQELTGAAVVAIDEARGRTPEPSDIPLRHARIEAILGMSIPAETCAGILRGLGVVCDRVDDDGSWRWRCAIPTHRPDLEREIDLVEEVMRHHGLEDLPHTPTMPSAPSSAPSLPLAQLARDAIVDAWSSAGFHEHLGFAFTDEHKLRALGGAEGEPARFVRVANPLRSTQGVMRTHLLVSLLDALALNAARHARATRLFEVGATYAWDPNPAQYPQTAVIDARLPRQRTAAVAVAAGAGVTGRELTRLALDGLELAGAPARLQPLADDERASWLHPRIQVAVVATVDGAEVRVGVVGELHPFAARAFELDTRVYVAALDLDRLGAPRPPKCRALPRFPSTTRDLSLEIDDGVHAATIVEVLRESARAIEDASDEHGPRLDRPDDGVSDVVAIEAYRGEGIPAGHKALLLRLGYRSATRSVTDAEVQALHEAIVKHAMLRLREGGIVARPR